VRWLRITGSLWCLIASTAIALQGQERDSLAGLPVRVMPRCDLPSLPPGAQCKAVVGTLVRRDSDSLTLRTVDNVEHRLAWPALGAVDVSRRTHGHLGTGTLVGLGAGAVAGEVLRSSCASTGGEDAGLCVVWFLITVPSGLLLGSVVGVSIRSPTWESVVPPSQVGVSQGYRFGVSLRAPW
jgi:hypothetical protein